MTADQPQETIQRDPPKRSRRRRWRILILAVVITLSALALFYAIRQQQAAVLPPVERFANYLRQDDIKGARSLYYEEIFGDSEAEAEARQRITETLAQLGEDYAAGRRSYESCLTMISALRQTNILIPEQAYSDLTGRLDELLLSKQAYQRGLAAMQQRAWSEAIEAFRTIIPDDVNYEEAQDELQAAVAAYETELTVAAEALAGDENLAGAVSLLEGGMSLLPDSEELNAAFADLSTRTDTRYRSAILDRVDEVLAEQSKQGVADALSILDHAATYLNNLRTLNPDEMSRHPLRQVNLNSDLQAFSIKRSRIQADLLQELELIIDTALAEHYYRPAMLQIQEARQLFPEDEAVLVQQTRLQQGLELDLFQWLEGNPADTQQPYLYSVYKSGSRVVSNALLLFPRFVTATETELDLLPYEGDWLVKLPPAPLAYNELTLRIHLLSEQDSDVASELEITQGGITKRSGELSAGQRGSIRVQLAQRESLSLVIKFRLNGEEISPEQAMTMGLSVAVTGTFTHSADVDFAAGAAQEADPWSLTVEQPLETTTVERMDPT